MTSYVGWRTYDYLRVEHSGGSHYAILLEAELRNLARGRKILVVIAIIENELI